MILDQQYDTPNTYTVGGANYIATYPRNFAAFNLFDLYKEILTFSLKVSQCVRFRLER